MNFSQKGRLLGLSSLFVSSKRVIFPFFLLVSVFALVSCEEAKRDEPSKVSSSSINSESYLASEMELDTVKALSSDVVNWKVAKAFVKTELKDNKDYVKWQSGVLSERPIIIYGNSGMPLYYEFRVRDASGGDIGYITANALKSRGYPIAFTSEFPQDYSKLDESSEKMIRDVDTGIKLVSAGYPNVAFAPMKRGVRTIMGVSTDDTNSEVPVTDENPEDILSMYKDNKTLRESLNLTEADIEKMQEITDTSKQEAVIFWNAVDESIEKAAEVGVTDLSLMEVQKEYIDNEAPSSDFEVTDLSSRLALSDEAEQDRRQIRFKHTVRAYLDSWSINGLKLKAYENDKLFYINCGAGAMTFYLVGLANSWRARPEMVKNSKIKRFVNDLEYNYEVVGTNFTKLDTKDKQTRLQNFVDYVASVVGGAAANGQTATAIWSHNRIIKKYNIPFEFNSLKFKIDSAFIPSTYWLKTVPSLLNDMQKPMMTLNLLPSPHWLLLYGAENYYERIVIRFIFVTTLDFPYPVDKRWFVDNGFVKDGKHFFTRNVNPITGLGHIYFPAVD